MCSICETTQRSPNQQNLATAKMRIWTGQCAMVLLSKNLRGIKEVDLPNSIKVSFTSTTEDK